MAIIPWILAVVIALAGAALHLSASGRATAHQAQLSEIQTQGEAHRAGMVKEHEAAMAPLLAESTELQTTIAEAEPVEAAELVADTEFAAVAPEMATASTAVSADAVSADHVQADTVTAAAAPEAEAPAEATTVSQFVPYTELIRLPLEALMDTDPRTPNRIDTTRLTAAANLFRERAEAKEMDAGTARAALTLLGIIQELQAAKERSRERFKAAADAQPSTHSSNPRIVEEMRVAAVERAERNAEAEYARLVAEKKGQIGQLYQILRDGENAVQEQIAKGPDAKRYATDPERKDLERQVARQEKALADLRDKVTELQAPR